MLVYLDHISVFSKSPEEHAEHLRLVLQRLRERAYATRSERLFNQPELEFLGHLVGREGSKVLPSKIALVKEWRVPQNVPELIPWIKT